MERLVLIHKLLHFSNIIWKCLIVALHKSKTVPLVFRKHVKNLSRYVALREKCPNTEFFLVRIFPHSDWIRVSLGIQSKCEKYGPEKNSVFGHFSRCVDSYDNITLIGDFHMTPEDKNLQHFTDAFILEYLIDKPNFSQRNSQAVLILLSPTKNHTSKKLV